MELQKEYLRSSDADIRTEALQWQVKAAKYDESNIRDALQLIIRHKNEPATVQREIFRSLKEIPIARFKEGHLELLTQIVRNVLDGAGASVALSLMMGFLGNVLSVHPRWAARQMALVTKETAAIPGLVRLSGIVPVKEVMSIVQEEMSPALDTLLRKQDGSALTMLARSFEEYMKYWPELLETCNKTFEIPEMEKMHEMMMGVVSKYKQRSNFWPHIIPLLTKENKPVAGSRHLISRIHRQYQNLLEPYLHPSSRTPGIYEKERRIE